MISQLSLGLYAVVYSAKAGCESVIRRPKNSCLIPVSAILTPPIPLPVYTVCDSVGRLSIVIAFNLMVLAYGTELFSPFIDYLGDTHSDHHADLLAFSVIVYLVVRSKVIKVPIPSLLKTMVRDATYYFLVIFTSHLVLLMFLIFVSVSTSS